MITDEEAKNAVKALIKWIGDDPEREGLKDTPERVIKSFKEHFLGYKQDPYQILKRTFNEISSYNDIILLKNITVNSHCEHHIAPIIGKAHVAYYPQNRVIGISKIARVVDILSKRLQIQERLTNEIAQSIYSILKPRGVAICIIAKHSCMNSRGIYQKDSDMRTCSFLGCFQDNKDDVQKFFTLLNQSS